VYPVEVELLMPSSEARKKRDNKNSIRNKEVLGKTLSNSVIEMWRKLTFDYAQRCGETVCYQCGKKIETYEEFSMEHKIPWRNKLNGRKLFFDLDNISFSHHTCNSRAGQKTSVLLQRKPVRRVSDGVIFESAGEAQKVTGIHATNICQVANGRRKTAGREKWEYVT
jgi:hypothetical protein